MPLSRAFLSLGISSELPLFCSVIPTPEMQVVVGPVLAWWQRGQGPGCCRRAPQESQWQISCLCGTSEVCVLSLGGILEDNGKKLEEGLVGCTFIN